MPRCRVLGMRTAAELDTEETISMRLIPVDTARVRFVGTGKTAERAEYGELSDGSRRKTGNQDKNDAGVPMWVVDVLVDDPDAARAEIAGVKVPSWDPPVTRLGAEVRFVGLCVKPWVQGNFVQLSWQAEGLEGAKTEGKAAA